MKHYFVWCRELAHQGLSQLCFPHVIPFIFLFTPAHLLTEWLPHWPVPLLPKADRLCFPKLILWLLIYDSDSTSLSEGLWQFMPLRKLYKLPLTDVMYYKEPEAWRKKIMWISLWHACNTLLLNFSYQLIEIYIIRRNSILFHRFILFLVFNYSLTFLIEVLFY